MPEPYAAAPNGPAADPAPAASDPVGAAGRPAAPARKSLVDELLAVRDHAAGKPIRIAEIVRVLSHRGPALVMLLLSLPFVIPVPLPGLSTPLGAAIMIYGIRVMLRLEAWVPGFIGNRTLSYSLLDRLVNITATTGRRVEKLLRPRLKFMLWPAIDVPIGLSLAFCGFFLGLPLPIPFTNAIPAVALILLLLGMIERDGVAILLGELISVVILGLCVYVCWLFYRYGLEEGWKLLHHVWSHSPASQPTTDN